jgi:glycosyltransferase involved in cell wall biosynthesis
VSITAIAFAPSDTTCRTYAYASVRGRIFMTTTGGQSWFDLDAADDAPDFAAKVLACMDSARGEGIGSRARARILADYAWSSRLALLDDLIERSDLVRQPFSAQAPLRRLVAVPASKA